MPDNIDPQQCNMAGAYKIHEMEELIQFLHACGFSPTKATWIDAI